MHTIDIIKSNNIATDARSSGMKCNVIIYVACKILVYDWYCIARVTEIL